MNPGQRLTAGEFVRVGAAVLTYQGDGNLVLYVQGRPVWASDTFGAPGHVEMQHDGNLVIYDGAGVPIWASNTVAPGARLVVSPAGLEIVAQMAIWRTPPVTTPEPGPGPEPGPPLARLRVEDNRRWFATDAGRFDYREKSAFSLLGRLMAGEVDYVREYVRWAKSERFTVLRVFICNPLGHKSGPDMPGFWEACDSLVTIFEEGGVYLRACFIAATEPFGGVWQGHSVDIWNGSVRERGEQFCVEFAARYANRAAVVGELFNEPVNIGLRRSQDAVVSLGRKVKAVAPDMLLCGGHYEDSTMCVRPFDFVTVHPYRAMEVRGFNWIKRCSEYAPIQRHSQPDQMPVLTGEPANFGQSRKDGQNGDVVREASAAFAYGGLSRAHMFNANFHSDDGLWTDMPEPVTLEHIRAFHDALDAFPMLTGNPWTGHHGQAAGDYWSDVWPPDDAIAEQWVAEGRGPWRAYGNGPFNVCLPEPVGWDWARAAQAPMDRVAHCASGSFHSGIYRRRS